MLSRASSWLHLFDGIILVLKTERTKAIIFQRLFRPTTVTVLVLGLLFKKLVNSSPQNGNTTWFIGLIRKWN